jgi:hypothetical protein
VIALLWIRVKYYLVSVDAVSRLSSTLECFPVQQNSCGTLGRWQLRTGFVVHHVSSGRWKLQQQSLLLIPCRRSFPSGPNERQVLPWFYLWLSRVPNFISYPLSTQNLHLPFYPSSPYPPDKLVQVHNTSRSPRKLIPWNTPGWKLQRYLCACGSICDRVVYQLAFWCHCKSSNNVRSANRLTLGKTCMVGW